MTMMLQKTFGEVVGMADRVDCAPEAACGVCGKQFHLYESSEL
jgi:hypothetical protein